MKSIDVKDCEVQILVCTNERPPGKSCCHKLGGQEFYLKFKNRLKEAGLYDTHWVTRTGCLGFCNDVGTTVAIHRRGGDRVWYNEVTAEDFETIWKESTKK